MESLSTKLSTAAAQAVDTATGLVGATSEWDIVGGGAHASAGELAGFVGRRSAQFVDGFSKTCVEATRANVRDAGEILKTTTLNAAIRSEASATSDLPTFERAVTAMSANAQKALDDYDERSRTLPQLRYELLEDLSRRKLALEKKIDAATAPREQARRQTLKDIMRKTDASEREARDASSS